MSRLGVVRWHSSLHSHDNSSSYNNISTFNIFSLSMREREEWLQADLCLSLGVVTALAVHVHYSRLTRIGMSTVLALVSLVVSLILAPLVGAALLIFSCYRHLVSTYLRIREDQKFAGLLDGTDAIWAIEEEYSLSVINILALADFSFIVSASTQDNEPLQTIAELIQDRLLAASSAFSKLLCHRRHSDLGYSYWVKQDYLDISEHIRWMDIEDQGDQTITESTLKSYVSSLSNMPLPSQHKAGWEILVGRYPIKPSSDLLDAMENGGWITKSCAGTRYPVLFRIHHSIGDGVALVNLLLEALGDPSTRSNTPVSINRCSSPSFDENFVRPNTPSLSKDNIDPVVISSWQESDLPCNKISPCDFKSIFVDIPLDSKLSSKQNRSHYSNFCNMISSYNSGGVMDELKSSVKTAYQRVLTFIEETKEFKKKLNEREIDDFEIIVNDRPSGEFLNMMKNATTLECKNEYTEPFLMKNSRLEKVVKKSAIILNVILKLLLRLIRLLRNLSKQLSVLIFAPAALFNQVLLQTQDVNLLHGPKLSGHKVVAWYLEQQDNPDQLLMSMIKRIRSKTGVKFSDVLLTALSASLESFYVQCKEVPDVITVVIPAMLALPVETVAQASTKIIKLKNFSAKVTKITGSAEKKSKLENKFSVAMLPLPIVNESNTKLKLFYKLRQVRKHCEVLRNSPDYLVNYWLLRVVAKLVPTWFLAPLLGSTHSTLVFSNLPGPTRLCKLAGHTVHDLVFWVPNRTTTGVGVTVLSYAGRLQLGLIADRALIACQQDAQAILDNMALSIQQMDQISSPS